MPLKTASSLHRSAARSRYSVWRQTAAAKEQRHLPELRPFQRRRNRGGNGDAPPGNAETAGAKVFFRPRINMPNLLVCYTQFCITALQESSPEELSMHQSSWRPGRCPEPHWGSLRSPSQTPYLVGRALTAIPPLPITPPRLSPPEFEFVSVALPP